MDGMERWNNLDQLDLTTTIPQCMQRKDVMEFAWQINIIAAFIEGAYSLFDHNLTNITGHYSRPLLHY